MSGNSNSLAIQSAQTAFEIIAEEIFGAQGSDAWKLLAMERPLNGQFLELNSIADGAVVRQLVGPQIFGASRYYAHRIGAAPYTLDAIKYPRTEIIGDKAGLIATDIKNRFARAGNFWYTSVIGTLLANPIGIDKFPLFSTTHPFAPNGGVWSNKTTNVLSQAEFSTGVAVMRALRGENGLPLGMNPTHLFVSPKNERLARDLVGADRIVAVSNTGALDATSGVVAAAPLANYVAGQIVVVVEPLMMDGIHDDDWFLADLSKPSKPMLLGVLEAPKGMMTEENDELGFHYDMIAYTVRGLAAIGGAVPQTVYGRMT